MQFIELATAMGPAASQNNAVVAAVLANELPLTLPWVWLAIRFHPSSPG